MQPLNGKMMFMDFPFRRPIYFVLSLSNGDEVTVSESEYRNTSVGESIRYDHEVWEIIDYVFAGIILAIVIGLIVLVMSVA